jgi:phosphoserine phosphatase RsbU/P
MIKKNSLSFRIISHVLAITIFLFVVIISLNYYFSRTTIKESTTENAIHLANNTVGKIEQILQPMEKIPKMVAALMEVQPIYKDSLFNIVEAIVQNNETIFGAAIAFEPGFFPDKGRYFAPYAYRNSDHQVLTMSLGGNHYEYFYMDWYQIPKMLNRPYWTEPYFDEGGGNELMATFSVPFYIHQNGQRVFAGIATVDLDLDWLTDIVSEVKIFESGYAFMLSSNGTAVTHPDKTMIMNKSVYSNAEEWNAPILREIGRDLRQGISRFREYQLPGRDKSWIYYRNLDSNQWAISVVFPDKEMFGSLRQMTTILISLFVAGLILLTLIIAGMVNRLASPLTLFAESARNIANGQFDQKLPEIRTKDEMKELHDAFSHMQEELARYVIYLQETTAAKEKIESELRIAREIQMAMIPHSFPPFPDLPQIDLFATLRSAKEVGGDLYDFFMIDKRFYFAIGDVSGKGVPASLFMAVTRTLLRSIADKDLSPKGIMGDLNKSLAFNNESNMFVTFFLGVIDLRTGILQFANAGHNPPVIIKRHGEVSMFEQAKAIPLGLFEDFAFTESSMQLHEGDKIFAYTDGVNEAENQHEELFGDERMLQTIQENQQAHPKDLIITMEKAVLSHVKDHPQSDDITMMTILYNGKT